MMNKTKEYDINSCNRKALLTAKSLYEKGEYYTAFCILKGLGIKIGCGFNYEFVINKKKINLCNEKIDDINTISIKIVKDHPWITEKEFNQF